MSALGPCALAAAGKPKGARLRIYAPAQQVTIGEDAVQEPLASVSLAEARGPYGSAPDARGLALTGLIGPHGTNSQCWRDASADARASHASRQYYDLHMHTCNYSSSARGSQRSEKACVVFSLITDASTECAKFSMNFCERLSYARTARTMGRTWSAGTGCSMV